MAKLGGRRRVLGENNNEDTLKRISEQDDIFQTSIISGNSVIS